MIFWWVTTLLHRLSIYFPLFWFLVWFRGRMTRVCAFSFGQSRSLFQVGPSLVSIEIGEGSLISSLKKKSRLRGHLSYYHTYWLQIKRPWKANILYTHYNALPYSLSAVVRSTWSIPVFATLIPVDMSIKQWSTIVRLIQSSWDFG